MAAEGSPSSAVSGRLTKGHVKAAHFYDASAEDACRILGTDATLGLSKDAVQARRIEFGPNEMTPPKKHGLWKKVWDQLANILIVILLAAAVVAGVLKDWVELGFILGVIIINVVIGVVQESKAEKAADALKKLLSASAIVLRDGLRAAVSASDLVPGDIIFLEAGDRVPADARLIIATNLAVMEAALTGESVAAPKDAATVLPNDATLADRHNMVFAGCLVTTGQCSAVITGTGDYCEIGKINKLVANVQAGKTPLLVQIEHFGRWLSVSVIVVAVITLLVAHFAREIPVGESFKIAVAVAVAIIPEGLPSVLTIILAFGVKAMAEKHAIIRQMPAVETLGAVSVICSDKTGTLTRNEMTAVQLRLGSDSSQALRFTGQGFSPEGEMRRGDAALHTTDRLRAMYALLPALLCNDAALSAKEDVSPAKQVPGAPPGIVAPTVVEIRDDKVAAASDKSAGAAEPTVPSSPSRTTLGHPAAASGERALASPATQSGRAALSELHQNVSLAEVARQQSERNVLAAAALAAAAATTAATAAISSTRASSSSSFGSPSEAFNLTAAGVTPSGGSTGGSATADADAAAFAATVGQFSAVTYAQGAVWSVTGDPTEAALLVASMKAGWKNAVEAQQRFPRLSTVPFDSDNKFMASLHDVLIPKSLLGAAADGTAEPALSAGTSSNGSVMVKRRLLLVKGAPDRLIPRCVKAVTNGNPFDASPIVPSAWQANADSLSAEGMRVLCLAMAVVPEDKTSISAADVNGGEPSLTLTALVGIVDPPREECVAAIAECKTAGVAVKMITGDSPLTAKTIGGWLGIPNTVVLTGQQLQAMSDDELTAKVIACNIYARATPEHKLRIVQALHRHKLCAAMTGDGVNDAAALKAANVGIAMGITGTEVAKEASRMVLADDNFSTIVAAIKEGRRVYDNLKKVLLFVLPTNVAQGICILAAIVIGLPFPLNAIQILYVNMITSVTLGLVLALEEAEPGIMGRPPRRSNKGIIGKQLLWRCFFVGGLLIIAMLGNMYWELQLDGWDSSAGSDQPDENSPVLSRARAVAMTTLTSGQVSYIFNCRYLKSTSLRSDILHSNPMLLLMAALNVGLQCLLIYAPGIQTAFGLAPISGLSWLRCIAMASALFLIVEAEKAFGPRFLMPLFNPCLRPCKRVLNPRGAAERQVESGAIALPVPAGSPSSAVSSVAVASAASPASVSLEMTSGR